MRHFTRELHMEMQRPDGGADAAWEHAVDEYEARLAALRPSLPAPALALLDGHLLHDAVVLGMGHAGGRFVLTLRLDAPPNDVLTIAYDVPAPPVLRREAFPGMAEGKPLLLLYDELEAAPGGLQHSMLFSSGWELEVRFHEVEVLAASPVLAGVPNPPELVAG